MKSEQLLRATSTVLLMTLNIIGALVVSSVRELKADVKTVNKEIREIQINLYGAQKDISVLQKSSYQIQPSSVR